MVVVLVFVSSHLGCNGYVTLNLVLTVLVMSTVPIGVCCYCRLKSACRGPVDNNSSSTTSSSTSSTGKPRMRQGVAVVEGAVGFAAVPVAFPAASCSSSSSNSYSGSSGSSYSGSHSVSVSGGDNRRCFYASTVPCPKLAMERLSQDIAGTAEGMRVVGSG